MVRVCRLLLVGFVCTTLLGCAHMQTNQGKGTAVGAGIGAGVGAIVGQAIGRDTKGTLIGAGIGALVGGLAGNQIGRYMDMQEQDLRNAIAASDAASVQREQDVLRATFKGEAYFDFDKSALKPGAYYELKRIADVLNKYPQTTIEVGGHTDTKGSAAYNQKLSERRAVAVKDELIRNGVAPQRISAIGYGETRPISSSDSVNRRVEILIVPVRQG
ncbi:membrane protein [Halodesulfovibrio spirochaetisodalis]|uniref:Membrane protein n=2 Tax=Halodesulfovibrio spirochaetisodalis TaxID=1560234 RepID=A0A1B7X9L9_9BACT|nr:membrane protein [Halodesulfovibrio spirochaetisodalis]